jgi:haloalkane dehalogenase
MDVVRTPDQRFARLPEYPYPAGSLALGEEGDLRLAYVAEGAHDSPAVLLLHGPPTWSFLWRRVIPMLVEGGCRVVAPDLVGFGRSDKLGRPREHRLDRHSMWVMALVEELDLRKVTVVAHGAAALLALGLVSAGGDRFSRLVGVCPLLATSGAPSEDLPASEQVARGCAGPLSDAIRAGYDAPFAEAESAGLRAQPSFLEGWAEDLPPIELPILSVAGERDELADVDWTSHVPGPLDRRRRIAIPGAGHYLPEDRGPELALALLAFLAQPA